LINRRQWLYGVGAVAGAGTQIGWAVTETADSKPTPTPLDLSQYEPKSMLQVHESHVDRAKFPVIDFHTHISLSTKSEKGVELSPDRQYLGTPQELLAVMDRKNIHTMVNLTGGYEKGLAEAVSKYDRAYPGRFYTFAEPSYSRFKEADYPKLQAQAIEQGHRDGARGLKILKTLGLYLREDITSGTLVKIDDPRFDPMWDACGQLNMPVAIHISDPVAFFTPTDRFNERYEELNNHPDWSFYGGDFPSNADLIAARNRVMARHPKTQFVTLHFGGLGNWDGSRSLPESSSTNIRIASCLRRTPRRTGTNFLSRFSTTSCMRSTTASWRQRTSISTMLQRKYRRRDGGGFTASTCRIQFCARSTTTTLPGFCEPRCGL